MKIPLDDLKKQLEDIYDSELFPIYCLVGGVLATGMSNDYLWALIGLGACIYFMFKRR